MKFNRQIQHAYKIQLDNQVQQKRRLKTQPPSNSCINPRTIEPPKGQKQRLYQDYFLQILRDQKRKQQNYLNSLTKKSFRVSSSRRQRIISEKLPDRGQNNNNQYFSNRIAESIRYNRRVIQQEYKGILDRQIERKHQKSKQEQADSKSVGQRVRYHDPILNPVGYQVWSKQLKTFVSPYSFS